MRGTLRMTVGLMLALVSVAGLAAPPIPSDFDRSDSFFAADETHEAKPVAEGPRKGWIEHRDTVRFGAYGFSVVQRTDPATGLPPVQQQWGDTFVGFSGKKPASYMSSNWSPWDFLAVSVRLRGDTADLPQPTRRGRLVFCGLTEVTTARIVAEVTWEDAAGGAVHARFIGWRGADRCGVLLSYLRPAGREIESLKYTLVCQPYDYSDRGYWERKRYVMTTTGGQPLPDNASLAFDPAQAWQFVFHNRFAQNDAGTLLAVDRQSQARLAMTGAGNTVQVTLTPKDPGREVVLVLGDWVDEAYPLAAARFFASADAVAAELQQASAVAPAAPPAAADAAQEAEMDALLQAAPGLQADFAPKLETARAALRQAATPLERARAATALAQLTLEIRSQWVIRGLWQVTPH